MKIAFITIEAPFGNKEIYINRELSELVCQSNFIIFPIINRGRKTHNHELIKFAPQLSRLESIRIIIICFFKYFFTNIKILFVLFLLQKPKRYLYTIYFYPRTLLLAHLIKELKIKHLHAYWGSAPATCALIASWLTKTNFSFTLHRADIESNDILDIKAERALFVRSISKWGKRKAAYHGIDKSKIKVIHLGVDVPAKVPAKKNIGMTELVTVSSFMKVKRTLSIIKKVAGLNGVRLNIIGDGPERSNILRYIKTNNLERQINLYGHLPNDKLLALYKRKKFDLFILASRIEGIPVSAMEAMANSIAVVSTNVGGVSELINQRTGYFIDKKLSNLNQILKRIPEKSKITRAYAKVKNEFNVCNTSKEFLKMIYAYAKK